MLAQKSSNLLKLISPRCGFGNARSYPLRSLTMQQKRFYASENIMKVTDDTFTDVVEKATKPILVDCKASWCGPCKILGPKLEKAVNNAKGAVQMAIVDIDESPETAEKLQVSAVPSVFAYHKGEVVDKFVGNLPDAEIEKFIKRLEALNK